MKLQVSLPYLLARSLVLSTLLIAGCSSSSSNSNTEATNSDNSQSNSDALVPSANPSVKPEDSVPNDTADNFSDSGPDTVFPETADDTNPASPDSDVPDSGEDTNAMSGDTSGTDLTNDPTPIMNDPVVPDPSTPVFTRVNFNITVPVYVSDNLQVRLVWGKKTTTAMWVGDEFWSVSIDLPTNTEELLVVTFYDNNGDLALASFEGLFKTGTNAGEEYSVTAAMFDATRWDADNDGVNNLDESLAGTNPLADDTVLLEIRDSFQPGGLLAYRAGLFETMIPEARPYSEQSGEDKPLTWNEEYSEYEPGLTDTLTIELDETGTGTLAINYRYSEPGDVTTRKETGVRSNTGHSIIWTGTYDRYNSSAGVGDESEFSVETSVVDNLSFTQTATSSGDTSGYGSPGKWDLSYTLTGNVIENSDQCFPISGSFSSVWAYTGDSQTVATKGEDELFWTITVTSSDGLVEDEYLARSFGATFFCAFNLR